MKWSKVIRRRFQALRHLPELIRPSDEFCLHDNIRTPPIICAKIGGLWFSQP